MGHSFLKLISLLLSTLIAILIYNYLRYGAMQTLNNLIFRFKEYHPHGSDATNASIQSAGQGGTHDPVKRNLRQASS
ncbi:hypothetical protein BJX70DRAFT_120389 [Aspergillus crustosus]